MVSSLLQFLDQPALSRLSDAAPGAPVALTGLSETLAHWTAAALAQKTGRRVLLILPNDLAAVRAYESASQLGGDGVCCLNGAQIDLTRGAVSQEQTWRRLDALTRIVQGGVSLLCASLDALTMRMGNPEEFRAGTLRLRVGDRLPPEELLARLIRVGYERVKMVEGRGQCARRGDIVDVFPPCGANAWRIEYFDDEIDSIRSIDVLSQRTLERAESALLSPAAEVILPEALRGEAAGRMRRALEALNPDPVAAETEEDLPPLPEDEEEPVSVTRQAELDRRLAALQADAELVAQGLPFRRIRAWLPVLDPEGMTGLLDWYKPQLILLWEPETLRLRTADKRASYAQDLTAAIERGEAVQALEPLYCDWDEVFQSLQTLPCVLCSSLLRSQGGFQPKAVENLHATALDGYHGQIAILAKDLKNWRAQNWTVLLLSGGAARGQRLSGALHELGVEARFLQEDESPDAQAISILPLSMAHGFLWPDASLAVVSDADIWGASYRKSKSRRNEGQKLSTFTELHPGDYVVHEDNGIGIFQGITRMFAGGAWQDYMAIQYAGSDRLYVPVDQFQRIQRYIGNPSQPPKINKLGGAEWRRQKSKVKEGLRKIAFDLTALYARRMREPGHAFPPDTPWQREFEDHFPYELTPDQEQSVREITQDMEAPHNMDRLLVGDVGYGKTEVSLRAAFKAVMDGKQVALLAPTTILAQQHYRTIVQRFEGFPIRADVLSRFRTPKEQKQVLADLSIGKIDILVGTHRLLAKDVKFKDLGLLIVDEEQRFGVQHKEIIKNMKSQMDVLTLSATPIPRTLHMSMIGIRDMSVLETPPEDRLPVQTHVIEYSDALVREAILRELSRGGQVYFLYNRVQSIERFYQRLSALVPEARIGVAHGQMREQALEDVMMDFYAGSYDILLCTTIIESGLDIPTANTLIVFDADRFGLSQLYQLRGRVGRSSQQAYAYFTVREDKILSETAEQRLSAIREFTEFGAGFRIALRDLEIRGAGDILGPEQHGHLATVGYETYCKLMEETMIEAKGIPSRSELETRVGLNVDAYLPNDYVEDEMQRMEIYRRIASLRTESDRMDITDELVDRYGEPPEVVQRLLDVSQFRAMLSRLGITQARREGGALMMRVDSRFVPDPLLLMQAMWETDRRLTVPQRPQNTLLWKGSWADDTTLLKEAIPVFRRLLARLDELEAEQKKKTAQEGSDS
ncbi:MAG: transcription-repair coupling factor [Clostridia bacterium]|nr:transcription-repair coupling factor [Clostridia bacterium]